MTGLKKTDKTFHHSRTLSPASSEDRQDAPLRGRLSVSGPYCFFVTGNNKYSGCLSVRKSAATPSDQLRDLPRAAKSQHEICYFSGNLVRQGEPIPRRAVSLNSALIA
jgi:hypothetical protein